MVGEKELEQMKIKKEGFVFSPRVILKDGSYEIINTAEEVYQEWLENKDIKVLVKPSTQDALNAKLMKYNAELLKTNEQQKKLNADLLLKIAMLGGKVNV